MKYSLIVITGLVLLGSGLLVGTVQAATTDFVANGDITISQVSGVGVVADLTILNGSRAESWTYDNNRALTVTNPDSSNPFRVTSTANAIHELNSSGTEIDCVGSGATLQLTSNAGTYTIYSSDSGCSSGSTSSGSGGGSSGGGSVTRPPTVTTPPPPLPTITVSAPVTPPSSLRQLQLQLMTTQLKLLLQLLVNQLQTQLQDRISRTITPAAPVAPPPLPPPVPPFVAPVKQLQLQLMTTQLKLLLQLLVSQLQARVRAIGQ